MTKGLEAILYLNEGLEVHSFCVFLGIKEEESVHPTETTSAREEAWHQELRSAYLQQYVQYMQSLQFIVVQTRPQSPKPTRR